MQDNFRQKMRRQDPSLKKNRFVRGKKLDLPELKKATTKIAASSLFIVLLYKLFIFSGRKFENQHRFRSVSSSREAKTVRNLHFKHFFILKLVIITERSQKLLTHRYFTHSKIHRNAIKTWFFCQQFLHNHRSFRIGNHTKAIQKKNIFPVFLNLLFNDAFININMLNINWFIHIVKNIF